MAATDIVVFVCAWRVAIRQYTLVASREGWRRRSVLPFVCMLDACVRVCSAMHALSRPVMCVCVFLMLVLSLMTCRRSVCLSVACHAARSNHVRTTFALPSQCSGHTWRYPVSYPAGGHPLIMTPCLCASFWPVF